MRALAILLLFGLCACSTTSGPPPGPSVVHIQVPASCVAPDFPRAPAYTDTRQTLQQAPDMAARYNLLAGNWAIRDARLAVLEKQVDACR